MRPLEFSFSVFLVTEIAHVAADQICLASPDFHDDVAVTFIVARPIEKRLRFGESHTLSTSGSDDVPRRQNGLGLVDAEAPVRLVFIFVLSGFNSFTDIDRMRLCECELRCLYPACLIM